MSYQALPNNGLYPTFYQQLPVGTPGWQQAPVPGWGMNPFRAGPSRVGVGATPGSVRWNDAVLPRYTPVGAAEGSTYTDLTWGHVAGGAAGGIVLGLAFGYVWFGRKKK